MSAIGAGPAGVVGAEAAKEAIKYVVDKYGEDAARKIFKPIDLKNYFGDKPTGGGFAAGALVLIALAMDGLKPRRASRKRAPRRSARR